MKRPILDQPISDQEASDPQSFGICKNFKYQDQQNSEFWLNAVSRMSGVRSFTEGMCSRDRFTVKTKNLSKLSIFLYHTAELFFYSTEMVTSLIKSIILNHDNFIDIFKSSGVITLWQVKIQIEKPSSSWYSTEAQIQEHYSLDSTLGCYQPWRSSTTL